MKIKRLKVDPEYLAHLKTLPPNFEISYSWWREIYVNHHAHIQAYHRHLFLAAYRVMELATTNEPEADL